ncbi:MAG: ATP-binding protein [Solirubrobacteraceae bacterium]
MRSERPVRERASQPSVADDRCPYGLCDGSGFIVEEESNTASDCRCRPLRIARVRAARLEARIPNRYREVSFEQLEGDSLSAFRDQVGEVRRYVGKLPEMISGGRGLWIEGEVGTGKTRLAMLVSKRALELGYTVAIYSLPRLLSVMRQSIEKEEGSLGFIDRLCSVDLLHIDDLGAENQTEWVLEQLYSVINSRYEDERALVVTTNLNPEELRAQIGKRTVSRLREMCGDPLPFYGDDRRIPQPVVSEPSVAPAPRGATDAREAARSLFER